MKKWIKLVLFPVIGFLSLMWFLIRVIPKPSRAGYPCMKAAFPLASTFVLYIAGIFSSILFYKKAKRYLHQSRYFSFALAMVACLGIGLVAFLQDSDPVKAVNLAVLEEPNQPMGVGQGVQPGRVVWIYEPDATNENCKNVSRDYWSDDDNTDQALVNKMVSDALKMLTGQSSDAEAWKAIFMHHNNKVGKGNVGYRTGEKIVIKINLNGTGMGPDKINTSPQITYSILDQLINVVGVAQEDISIGDPNINFSSIYWTKCATPFPNVHYWGTSTGRTRVKKSEHKIVYTSDGELTDWLPQCYIDASYLINMPVFKKHHRAGISMSSKNHFGTFSPFNGGAAHWHYSLPSSTGFANVDNGEMKSYRCFVDIMGHEHLGGKTILYLMDGLWSSINWGHPPIKWRMAPFNNDWPSSVFASLDPVALESVGFDFLYEEFDENHPTEGGYDPRDDHGPFPHYAGADDFLHQSADSQNWPDGFVYDPENDGTPLPASMGVHEHWNNAMEKLYSRNMGKDEGIELVTNLSSGVAGENPVAAVGTFALHQNYPNPFNPSTTISFDLKETARVRLVVYDANGREVRTLVAGLQAKGAHSFEWDGRYANGLRAASGVYFYRLFVTTGSQSYRDVKRMVMSK